MVFDKTAKLPTLTFSKRTTSAAGDEKVTSGTSEDAMPTHNSELSEQATKVLEMIAAGSTYEQILSALPYLTYLDIFDAAREALDLSVANPEDPKPAYSVAEIRSRYPRAYERWSEADDEVLRKLARSGMSVARIANRLQRQRSAIRSRIVKLDLVDALGPHEQSELRRISALDPKDPADTET